MDIEKEGGRVGVFDGSERKGVQMNTHVSYFERLIDGH